jgi:hypothetical protein
MTFDLEIGSKDGVGYLPANPRTDEERELRRMLQSAGENDSLLIPDDVCRPAC